MEKNDSNHDELDLFKSVDAGSFYALTAPAGGPSTVQDDTTPRRSLRQRRPVDRSIPTPQSTRKRTISTAGIEAGTQKSASKKAKMDDKKAVYRIYVIFTTSYSLSLVILSKPVF